MKSIITSLCSTTLNIVDNSMQVNRIWIPYIIFQNTDNDEAVTVDEDTRSLISVTKQGNFFLSGPEEVDEVRKVQSIVMLVF